MTNQPFDFTAGWTNTIPCFQTYPWIRRSAWLGDMPIVETYSKRLVANPHFPGSSALVLPQSHDCLVHCVSVLTQNHNSVHISIDMKWWFPCLLCQCWHEAMISSSVVSALAWSNDFLVCCISVCVKPWFPCRLHQCLHEAMVFLSNVYQCWHTCVRGVSVCQNGFKQSTSAAKHLQR